MHEIVRIPITNIYAKGGYTGRIFVGPGNRPMNVLLDTGSSTLALSKRAYEPEKGDVLTRYAQTVSYADGSGFTAAVIHASVSIGEVRRATLANANVAIAYEETGGMFDGFDGILGLAYAALDDAAFMPETTWRKRNRYTHLQVARHQHGRIKPYLTQLSDKDVVLENKHVVSDVMAFYTRRSTVHYGAGVVNDPLNHGWMIVGGGEECKDLYAGAFQTARVLSQKWYSTNLKAVIVGDTDPIHVPKGPPSGNSIVDSGTQDLILGHHLWKAIKEKLDRKQREQFKPDNTVSMADLDLDAWPVITLVLEGKTDDVILKIDPGDYWQQNYPRAGLAGLAMARGDDGDNILGLPLMNGYFTIFDGEAAGGKGVVKFARIRP